MDINKNLQINTFTKGMNTDTSDMYMPTDQYRYAENLRVTSEDGTAGELRLIEGTQKITLEEIDDSWVQRNDVFVGGGYIKGYDDYDVDEFYITIKDLSVNDSYFQQGDDVLIIILVQEDGDAYKGVNGVNIKFNETPYKITIEDLLNLRIGWSYTGNLLDKRYYIFDRTTIGGARITLSSHDMDVQDMSAYIHVLYINNTQKYYSSFRKIGATKSYVGLMYSDWGPDHIPPTGGISEFQIVTQDPFEMLSGKILDVNYIKDICTIIEADNYLWLICVCDYEQGTLSVIAGPFDEPVWENWSDVGKKKILSTTIIWEADDNIKLYIADGIHRLMSVRIQKINGQFKKIDGDFNSLFLSDTTILPAPLASVSNQTGHILGAKVQYAYVLYEKYGSSSSLSPLSNWVSLYYDNRSGFINKESTRAVDVAIPAISTSTNTYIRIYRVSYIENALLPKVSVIFDKLLGNSNTFVDTGTDISNQSVSEFVASLDFGIRPKLIEQKNNYLFAANVKYSRDDVDRKFKDFDARCFTVGNYLMTDGTRNLFDGSNLEAFHSAGIEEVKNSQFDNYSVYEWNESYWSTIPNTLYNGIGKYLKWRYVIEDVTISPDSQTGSSTNAHNTYMRNEVYRFGIRLYDNDGNVSSVKWIADIKMPDYFDHQNIFTPGAEAYNRFHQLVGFNNGAAIAHVLNIEFTPNRDANDGVWDNISAYEIVQSPRGRDDTYSITQGIGGYPTQMSGNTMVDSYFLTTDRFVTFVTAYASYTTSILDSKWLIYGDSYQQNTNYLLFSSPEVVYQQDDVTSLLKSGSWRIKNIFNYLVPTEESVLGWTYKEFFPYYWRLNQWHNGHLYIEYNSDDPGVGETRSDVRTIHTTAINPNNMAFNIGIVKDNSSEASVVCGLGVGGYYLDNTIMEWRNKNVDWSHAAYLGYLIHMRPSAASTACSSADAGILKSAITAIPSENPDNFADANGITLRNKPISVGGSATYYNWTNPLLIDLNPHDDNFHRAASNSHSGDDFANIPWNRRVSDGTEGYWHLLKMPISAGGRYIMLGIDRDEFVPRNYDDWFGTKFSGATMPRIPVFLIYKIDTVPYKGIEKSSILNSTYISIGGFSNSDSSITVKGGDGYIKYFTFNHLSTLHNDVFWSLNTLRVVYQVPLESHIDVQGQASPYLYNIDNRVRDVAGSTNGFALDKDLYMYNTAYNAVPDVIPYYPNDELDKLTQYTTRIHYSLPKTNNEATDSWTKFKPVDFLDVDTRYGDITALKLFKDKLIFIQDKAAGVLSVNDRTIINDADSNNIILGNGGVLQRYDYITTLFGMKPNQKAYAMSNESLYWWDGYNKEIIQYQEGYNVNQLQHLKQINSYIQEHTESETPEIFYDKHNKEVVFNIVGDEAVVYNEKVGQFTSVYTFCPAYHCDLISAQIVIDNSENDLYEYNKSENNVSTLFGEAIKPLVKYVVNADSMYNKTFDIQTFGGRFYGGSDVRESDTLPYYLKDEHDNTPLSALTFIYNTPLKQESKTTGSSVTNYEYEYRLTIPRDGEGKTTSPFNTKIQWGNRMRGKTMQCELKSSSNNLDFSLQYIITKFRMSWT